MVFILVQNDVGINDADLKLCEF